MTRSFWMAGVAAAAMTVALGGCFSDSDSFTSTGECDIVGVVPRSQVQNIDDAFDVQFYSTAGGYMGEILAVCGYNFNRVASANRVVIDVYDCRVLNYVELDANARFGALFFQVPSTIPPTNALKLNVIASGDSSDTRPYFDVHRHGYAGPTSGTTVVANDVSTNPPTWAAGNDFNVPAKPDTLKLSDSGAYAYLTSGDSLYLVQLADGQLVIRADTFFSGNVGPSALSPDGKLMVVCTFPSAAPPELQVVDTAFVDGLPVSVNAANGCAFSSQPGLNVRMLFSNIPWKIPMVQLGLLRISQP